MENMKKLRNQLHELYQIECCMSILGYDQQVFMPAAAATGRAEQLEYLSGLYHSKISSDSIWELVQGLKQDQASLGSDDQVIVKEIYRTISRSRKLPAEFVAEKTKVCAESFSTWAEVMHSDSVSDIEGWNQVRPQLTRIVELAKEEANLVGYEKNPYDALLDSFEPYSTIAEVKPVLTALAQRIRAVLPELSEKYAATKGISGNFPQQKQEVFCKTVLEKLGFDFRSGRLDTAPHPFMSTLGPQDVRVTTRYNPDSFMPALFGSIHEFGHALYETGLPAEFRGTPRGSAVSMAIHESQSRLWENMVARSREFCVYISGLCAKNFEFNINPEDLYTAANVVRPSLIRVEADELTYSLHIVIRMLIEEMLLSDSLEVKDLPDCWNALYQEYLGVKPDAAKPGYFKKGLMQDIHWYSGSIGYFPSYALGNLYAAMFMQAFEKKCGQLGALIESDQLLLLNSWLKDNIHRHGQSFKAFELAENVCGYAISAEPFLEYLSDKHGIKI